MLSTNIAGIEFQRLHKNNSTVLRRIGFGLTRLCNLSCKYCLTDSSDFKQELTINDYDLILKDAIRFGVQTVVIVGEGEPTCSHKLAPLIRSIANYKLSVVLFTNGQILEDALVTDLVEARASVIVKLNSLDAKIHDALVGIPGAHKKAMKAIDTLNEAGFSNITPTRLGLQAVITSQNFSSIEPLWIYARSNNIFPYIETLRRCGRALNHPELVVEKQQLKHLFTRLQYYDKSQYDNEWQSCPPYVGFSCAQHFYSCFIRTNGDVTPCSGLPLLQGNVKESGLDVILQNDIFRQLRSLPNGLKGACACCHLNNRCYGCRANAWAVYGDYLAEDPDCWINL